MGYTYKGAVAKGMRLLDRRVPDWRELVNPGRLDANDPSCCVLGTVYGSYTDACRILSGQRSDFYDWAIAHGFQAKVDMESPGDAEARLQDAWLTALEV